MLNKIVNYVERSICYGLIFDLYPYVKFVSSEQPNWIYKIWRVFNRDIVNREVWEKYPCVRKVLDEIDYAS